MRVQLALFGSSFRASSVKGRYLLVKANTIFHFPDIAFLIEVEASLFCFLANTTTQIFNTFNLPLSPRDMDSGEILARSVGNTQLEPFPPLGI